MTLFYSQARFNLAFSAALVDGRIVPEFQPIVSLHDGAVVGFEVLGRWQGEQAGTIGPATFIPHVERGGMLDEMTDSLLRQAIVAARAWPRHLFLALNISPSQLHNPALPERIEAAAAELGFSLSRLQIEVTETAILDDTNRAELMLGRLIAKGCTISMDDFGTGFSSLTWLRSLPFSKIKIDTTFIRSMIDHKESRKIVAAMVALGQSLGLSVVAEGVETTEQAELLRQIGCGYGQGYLFGRALAMDAVPSFLDCPTPRPFETGVHKLSFEQRAYQISALYQSDNMAIAFVDRTYRVVDGSEAFATLMGRPAGAVIGCHVTELVGLEAGFLEKMRSYRLQGLPYPPVELPLPDERSALMLMHPVLDEANEFIGISVLFVDITAHKHTERMP